MDVHSNNNNSEFGIPSTHNPRSKSIIYCSRCGSFMKPAQLDGRIVMLCANYPNCEATVIPLDQYIFKTLEKSGIELFEWKRTCYKCRKIMTVTTYYLSQTLVRANPHLAFLLNYTDACIGDIYQVDKYLHRHYPNFSYISSWKRHTCVCEHCKAPAGQFYILEDPDPIDAAQHEALNSNDLIGQLVVSTIPLSEIPQLTLAHIRNAYSDK